MKNKLFLFLSNQKSMVEAWILELINYLVGLTSSVSSSKLITQAYELITSCHLSFKGEEDLESHVCFNNSLWLEIERYTSRTVNFCFIVVKVLPLPNFSIAYFNNLVKSLFFQNNNKCLWKTLTIICFIGFLIPSFSHALTDGFENETIGQDISSSTFNGSQYPNNWKTNGSTTYVGIKSASVEYATSGEINLVYNYATGTEDAHIEGFLKGTNCTYSDAITITLMDTIGSWACRLSATTTNNNWHKFDLTYIKMYNSCSSQTNPNETISIGTSTSVETIIIQKVQAIQLLAYFIWTISESMIQ